MYITDTQSHVPRPLFTLSRLAPLRSRRRKQCSDVKKALESAKIDPTRARHWCEASRATSSPIDHSTAHANGRPSFAHPRARMTHGERTRANDDPVWSVELACEREEDFDNFLSRLDCRTTMDFMYDYWTAELAERREETVTLEPIATSSVAARARESTMKVRKVKRHRAPPTTTPRAPRGRVKGFHTVMLEIRETLIAPALATLETFQLQGLFTDDSSRRRTRDRRPPPAAPPPTADRRLRVSERSPARPRDDARTT